MICRKCDKEQPSEQFYTKETICKRCKKILRNRKRGVKRALITRYLGKKCEICGEKGTTSHEKYGQPHKDLLNTSYKELKDNCETGRFVRVCCHCHQEVHSLIENGINDWEMDKHYVKSFLKTNPPKERNPRLYAWKKFLYTKIVPKPMGQQLEFPLEVETVKTKSEIEAEETMKAARENLNKKWHWEGGSWTDPTCHKVYEMYPYLN